jgi:hypothetical protein
MSLATELVAGGFAGAVGIMATQPLDTIRSAVAIALFQGYHRLGKNNQKYPEYPDHLRFKS